MSTAAVLRRVCVYAASSRRSPAPYTAAAAQLGRLLAEREIEIVYGGGASGLMGALADAALAAGGHVVGPEDERHRQVPIRRDFHGQNRL